MKKSTLLIVVLLCCKINIYAQKHELGEVTIEELKEKSFAKDTSAVAAVLFEKGKTTFEFTQADGFKVVTEVDVKIKVYKKGGYDLANKEVEFYVGGNNDESVSFSKAITYNLVNGAIEKTKLKNDGQFAEKKNKFWSINKITMPNVKEGSIIEYRYTIKSPYTSTLPDWAFQRDIPVVYSEYTAGIPEYYVYNVYRKGFLSPTETVNKLKKTITLEYKQNTMTTLHSAGGVNRTSQDIYYVDTQTTFKLENIPALKEESFVNNINNYTASVEHELSQVLMPNSPIESFSNSWENVVKKIYDSEEFGTQLKKEGYFEDDLKKLLAGLTGRDEKIAAVFSYVKSRMNWNSQFGYYSDGGVKKAYADKTGNIAEINLMLTAMLRYAGVNANPVLLSTRANGIAVYPSRTAFNYVIAAVEIENDLILLDATNKNALPNVLPLRDLNWFGRIIRKEGTSAEVDLTPKMISKDYINVMAKINEKGEIEGKLKEQYFDYNAFNFRDKYTDINKESYIEKLEKKYNNIEVGEYDVVNKNEFDKPVIETYSFKQNSSVDIIGDKMYFSPLLFFAQTVNPFKQEKREYPVDFTFPTQDKYLISVTIPEGYAVESMPVPLAIKLGEYADFKFNISNAGKQIQISAIVDINTSIVPSESYGDLKTFFAEMIKKQTEKIVLKKI
ncbi:MAG: transglutaminase domain-containing protein [Flavobacterium sp.]